MKPFSRRLFVQYPVRPSWAWGLMLTLVGGILAVSVILTIVLMNIPNLVAYLEKL